MVEIKIIIEKKHLVFFVGFLLVSGVVFTFAQLGTVPKPGHSLAELQSVSCPAGQVLTSIGNGVPGGYACVIGSTQWKSSGNNIYYDTGNVGVGTNVPQSKLHTYNTDPSKAGLTLETSPNTNSFLTFTSGLPGVSGSRRWDIGVQSSTNRFTIFDTAQSFERLTIANSGNVGIGIVDPSSKLHVNGDIKTSGNLDVTGDVTFGGEIKPEGELCQDGQILKKNGAGDWNCAAETLACVVKVVPGATATCDIGYSRTGCSVDCTSTNDVRGVWDSGVNGCSAECANGGIQNTIVYCCKIS